MKVCRCLSLALLLGMALGQSLQGQTVQLPPLWTLSEKVSSLVNESQLPSRFQFSTRMFVHAGNNVLPLKLGDDKQLPPTEFKDNYAHFTSYRLKDLSLSYRRLTFSYGYGKADFYDGNQGAAQLYLDSMSTGIDWQKTYDVNASLSRTFLHRWSVEYSLPFKRGHGRFSVALHWLRVHRLQKGTLTGQMWLGQFQGDLNLLTTRGLPSHQTRSNGLALDLAAIVPINGQVRLGFWVENIFSGIWQRTLQGVTAKVATNTVEPDADGFLHAVPFLQGRIERKSLRAKARRIWTVGAAFGQRGSDWILLAQRERDWRVGVGYSFSVGQGKQVWLMVSERPFLWHLGVNTRGLQLLLGVDRWNKSSAKEATALVRWCWSF